MTVYVDDFRIRATVGPYTAHWSHLFTDSDDLDELHQFAQSIGLRRSWFQDKPSGAHYDVTDRIRRRAIRAGAHPIPWRDIRTVWPNQYDHQAGEGNTEAFVGVFQHSQAELAEAVPPLTPTRHRIDIIDQTG